MARNLQSRSLELDQLKSEKTANNGILLKSPDEITGMSVISDSAAFFKKSFIIVNADTFYLIKDIHEYSDNDSSYSYPVIFDHPVHEIMFYPGDLKGKVRIHFYNCPILEIDLNEIKNRSATSCSEPVMIDQSVWREDLEFNEFERIVQSVNNIIIHHSATSNSLTNYTNVVRNIYIYHTQTRGWSDIGYNFLVAPDGTIFKGRDPGNFDQDNVMGAHFCGRNSGTMGICMMGTYTDISPSDDAINALEEILSWKSFKDELEPLQTFSHPLNENLGVIAGHRDGCATECPGEVLYNQISSIKTSVFNMVNDCLNVDETEFSILPTQFNSKIYIKSQFHIKRIEIYEISGRKLFDSTVKYPLELSIDLSYLSKGIYVYKVTTLEKIYSGKLVFFP